MDTYVVKVQFEDTLRRLSLQGGDLVFSYAQLVNQTKDLFQIPATARLIFTYTDRDGDVVTMAEDQDLRDALVLQGLNPLRLHLATVSNETNTIDVKMNDPIVEHDHQSVPAIEKAQEINTEEKAGKGDAATSTAAPDKKNSTVSDTCAHGEPVVHKGITCDDCGMTPITGPRYKSITKEDYDLCRDCFDKPEVDPSDYIKIKRGRPDRRSVHFARGLAHGARNEGFRRHRHGMDRKGCPGKPCKNGRSEKQSGEDAHHGVTCDECKTSPIVGPRFKSDKIFNYDLCHNCFERVASTSSSDEYTRIDHPLHYNSLHMVMPRIVVTSVSHEEEEEKDAEKTVAANGPDVTAAAPAAEEAPAISMDVKMSDDRNDAKADILDAPANQPEIVVGTSDVTMTEFGKSAGSEIIKNQVPTNNRSENAIREHEQLATEDAAPEPAGDVSAHDGEVAKLASMGFHDNKLNEELLRKNNFDVQSTLDDLCAVKNWDPTLEELKEMGFYDSDLNRRLLAQNHGNVKPVVKELVRLTKEQTSTSFDGGKRSYI